MATMTILPPINTNVGKGGEIVLQRAFDLPANGAQPFLFRIKKGQKLSGFMKKTEQGGGKTPITAVLSTSIAGIPNPQPTLGHYTGRQTAADQRFAAISDGGESGSVNGSPDTDYYVTVWQDDGLPIKGLVLAFQNGGV